MNFDLGETLLTDYEKGEGAMKVIPYDSIGEMIKQGVRYEAVIEAVARMPLEGEREQYITLLKKRDQIPKEAIRKDIQNYLKRPSSMRVSSGESTKQVTEEDTKEALILLEDDNFWERFLDTTELLGCVGEDENKLTLYMSLTSRKQDDPINIIVKGESSAGKSYLVSSVSQFFPEEDILEFTALTPKALFHRKDNIKHKALIVYERSGAEESDYSIRTLQSEKKLIFSTPVKDPLTGNFETQDIEIEGPIAYIETTTRSHIHPENETRCFEIFIDESEEQTIRIYEAQNRKHEITGLDKEAILRPWKNAQRLLKPCPICIPYIDLIKFPTRPLRVRRDRPKFLALIEASALLRQRRREKKIINGREFILADIEDYTIAYSLVSKVLESVLKGLSPKVKDLIEVAKQFNDREFTNKDLREKVAWNEKTLEKYVKEAVAWGFFEIIQEGGRGKAYHYRLSKTDDSPIGLLTPEELSKELKRQIPKIPSNSQLGDGDFNSLIVQEKQSNPQYPQEGIKAVDV